MLYLIKTNNFTKIGYTKNLNNRISKYLTDNPTFEILGIKEGTLKDEQYYHERFNDYIIRTEWMELPDDILETVKQEFTPYNKNIKLYNSNKLLNPETLIDSFKRKIYAAYSILNSKDKELELFLYNQKYRQFYITKFNNELVFNPQFFINELNKSNIIYRDDIIKYVNKYFPGSYLYDEEINNIKKSKEFIDLIPKEPITIKDLENKYKEYFNKYNLGWYNEFTLKLLFPNYTKFEKYINNTCFKFYNFY